MMRVMESFVQVNAMNESIKSKDEIKKTVGRLTIGISWDIDPVD